MIMKCPACPLLFYDRHPRTYCSNECRQHVTDATNRLLVAELEWIAGTDTWDNVARRLGFTNRRTLARRLSRLGHHDRAREIERIELPTPRQRAA